MSKDLSIIIPHYQEDEQAIFPILASIRGQLGISNFDIEVIIANDGEGYGPFDKRFLDLFKLDIKQINLETNRGPGVTRQAGLDIAQGDYVTFCDADDTLQNVGAIGTLLIEAKNTVPDMLTSQFLEEFVTEDGEYRYISHVMDNTWMHGKLFRRRFLTQNDIRFHEDLRIHEDTYFLSLAAAMSKSTKYLQDCTYVWKYYNHTITRRNNGIYSFDSFPTFLKSCTLSFHELENRNIINQMEYKAIQLICYIYFILHQKTWLAEEHAEYRKATEEAFAKYIPPFLHYWSDADPQRVIDIYNEERARTFIGEIENESIDAWFERILVAEDEN